MAPPVPGATGFNIRLEGDLPQLPIHADRG